MLIALFALCLSLPDAVIAQQKDARTRRVENEVAPRAALAAVLRRVRQSGIHAREGGTVRLLGHTIRPTLKTDAERRVKGISGVDEVINEIEVLPTSPNDDRIRLALARNIYRTESLERYGFQVNPSIHIIVKNGRVTLEGVVDTEGDKTIAGMKAREVGGVFEVTNNLRVEK